MNKIVFPALLVATIMVAGAFAFVPVEQASTVHLSGTTVAGTLATAVTLTGATTISGDTLTIGIAADAFTNLAFGNAVAVTETTTSSAKFTVTDSDITAASTVIVTFEALTGLSGTFTVTPSAGTMDIDYVTDDNGSAAATGTVSYIVLN